jgi:hypothetical protein
MMVILGCRFILVSVIMVSFGFMGSHPSLPVSLPSQYQTPLRPRESEGGVWR